jgi:hypothetical protein
MAESIPRRVAAALLWTALATPIPAAMAQQMTFGLDGHTWVQIGNSDFGKLQKLDYLRGIYDGLLFARALDAESYPHETSWDSLSASVDRIYADSANRQIPVALALQVVGRQLTGHSRQDVEASLAHFRCLAQLIRIADTTAARRRSDSCPPLTRAP